MCCVPALLVVCGKFTKFTSFKSKINFKLISVRAKRRPADWRLSRADRSPSFSSEGNRLYGKPNRLARHSDWSACGSWGQLYATQHRRQVAAEIWLQSKYVRLIYAVPSFNLHQKQKSRAGKFTNNSVSPMQIYAIGRCISTTAPWSL